MEEVQKVVRHGNRRLNDLRENVYKEIPDEVREAHDEEYSQATECCVCCKPFENGEYNKCFHHCHYSGKYLGAACNRCNINMECKKYIIHLNMFNL